MKTTQDSRPRWLLRFEADYHLRNLFTSYLSAQTFFVHGENWMEWWRIFRSGSEETPIHYEFLYGRWEDRIRYNGVNLEKVRREKKTVISSRSGFHDIFVPVLDRNRVVGVLVSGAVFLFAIFVVFVIPVFALSKTSSALVAFTCSILFPRRDRKFTLALTSLFSLSKSAFHLA